MLGASTYFRKLLYLLLWFKSWSLYNVLLCLQLQSLFQTLFFFWWNYKHACFSFLFICKEYFFPSLIFSLCVFRSEVGVLQAENIWDLFFICLPTVWFLIETFSAFNFKVIIVKYPSITILKIILGLPFVVLICSFLLLISSLEIWWQYLALCLDSSIVCVCVCVCVCACICYQFLVCGYHEVFI